MIRLIASDMDGTLLNDEGKLPKDFFRVYEQLKEKNILFVAASGRQYYNLLHNFECIKDHILFIAENGTYILQEGKELYSSFIEPSSIQELIDIGRTIEGANIVLCGKKSAYVENDNPDFLREAEKYYTRYEIVPDVKKVQDDILKFTLCDLKGAASNSNEIIYPKYKDNFKITVSGELWLDIINYGVDKGEAIKHIQEKLNISPEETMVFGDYYNDIEMLQNAYYSYAMENAPEEVKKHARFTAKSNNVCGVIEVIKERCNLL